MKACSIPFQLFLEARLALNDTGLLFTTSAFGIVAATGIRKELLNDFGNFFYQLFKCAAAESLTVGTSKTAWSYPSATRRSWSSFASTIVSTTVLPSRTVMSA
jgi:hypothetical protein